MAAFGARTYADVYNFTTQTVSTYPFNIVYYSSATNYPTINVPYARNRNEKRVLDSINNEKYLLYLKAVKLIHGNSDSYSNKATWNAHFWDYVIHGIPKASRRKAPKKDKPGVKPNGQSERIRTCSPRWTPVRA
jgi:hypothetical protein